MTPPPATPHRRAWGYAVVVFVAALLLSGLLVWRLENARLQQARTQALSLATERAQAIQGNLERAFSAAYALGAMVRQGQGEVAEFTDIATQMLPFYPGVASIQLAKDGVVSHIVPLAGNEKALGHNLLADPSRNKEAFLARDTGQLTLAGPFNLVQGGLGAAGRLPVYLGNVGDRARFWGFAVVLLRFPQALEPAQLPLLVQRGYHYELWRTHPDTQAKQIIGSNTGQPLLDPVTRELAVPNATWHLSISPTHGWNDPVGLVVNMGLGLAFSLLLAGLTKLLLDARQQEKWLEVRVAQRTSDLRRFSDITAHHLQEPVRRMASYGDLLGKQLAGPSLPPEVQRSLEFIGQQARYLQNLLRDVQRYQAADQPLGALQQVDTAAVAAQVLGTLADRLQAVGATVSVGTLPAVWFDTQRLANVFELLLDNALLHGRPANPAEGTEPAENQGLLIHIQGENLGRQVRYCVSDNGPGIEAQYRERVFRAFERLQTGGEGTGTGLALVRRMVESGGGRTWIDETPGGGCTVWWDLPGTEHAVQTQANDRHQATEQALLDSEAFMQDVLNSVQSEIAVIDEHGTILAVNQAWRLFASDNSPSPSQPAACTDVGTNYLNVCGNAADEGLDARSGISAVLEGRLPSFALEYPCHSPHAQRWFSMRVSPLSGSQKGAVIAHTDITERKVAEISLAASEVNLRTYCNNIQDFLFVLDPQGHILYTNDYVTERLHYSASDLLGQSVLAVHPSAQREEAMRIVTEMLAGTATVCPVPLQAKDGQMIPVETRVVHGHWNGQPALFGLSRDMSERLKVEQALARSNAELEQFAYVASHDLRQPLRMVNSYVQLLERRLSDHLDSDTREMMHFATDGARRMDQMLVSLLEYSRVGRKGEPMQTLRTRDAVDEALHFLAPAIQDAQATVEVSGDWPTLVASRDEFTRLWQNLIGNAIKYRAPQRTPSVHISVTRQPEGQWRFCVADNGIGIEAAQFHRLFKVFQRLHTREQYEGNGVGLAVARKIVERHGGRIWVESGGAGQGCRFCFDLPAQT